jgi:hypothetical protein
MTNDKKKFEGAMSRWHDLKAGQSFSVPTDVGKLAILCSYAPPRAFGANVQARLQHRRNVAIFKREALALTETAQSTGKTVQTFFDASTEDMTAVLVDHSVSDVVVIGHGNLSSVSLGKGSEDYDWEDVAETVDHLKTGVFTQRVCGVYARDLNVPLGTFAVNDMSNVIAPLGILFNPTTVTEPLNQALAPAFEAVAPTYNAIKRSFIKNY